MMTELEYAATKIKIERENEEKLKHYPILEKQLKIAIEELKTAINLACPYGKSLNDMFDSMKTIQKKCGIALQQIKELEK